jgi:polysaccharide export outer membrane protein
MTTPFLRILWIATSLLIVAPGCSTRNRGASTLYAEAARNDPRGRPYVIGASDVVRVTVWKDPNLSTDVVVRPDGTVTLPLIGEVVASGRTATELQKEVSNRLSAFVKDAVVTVAIEEVNSYRFTVAGNVEHPGLFTSRYYLTVSEALALAGGPNRYASTSSMVIVRNGGGKIHRIPIDYDAILSGESPEQDIVILPGDAVRVP